MSKPHFNDAILVDNRGSSSLKFGLYILQDGEETAVLDGLADAIGTPHAKITLKDASGQILRSESLTANTLASAFEIAITWLPHTPPVAIGHRVVHGGPNLTTHQRITPKLVAPSLLDRTHPNCGTPLPKNPPVRLLRHRLPPRHARDRRPFPSPLKPLQ
jgi:acetate kinase